MNKLRLFLLSVSLFLTSCFEEPQKRPLFSFHNLNFDNLITWLLTISFALLAIFGFFYFTTTDEKTEGKAAQGSLLFFIMFLLLLFFSTCNVRGNA